MKFLKRLMSKRNNAGFTLVEVVISVALLGILLVSMTMFVGPVLQAATGTKKDIRATILADTVDAFVDRSVKNSRYIAVFDGVAQTGSTQYATDIKNIYESEEYKKLTKFMTEDSNANIYDLRCISINWRMDDRTNEYKYMLAMNKLTDESVYKYEIKEKKQVYDDCFYDGLFPMISIEQVYATDGTTKVPALKIGVDVFSNDAMTDIAISGAGYTELINLSTDSVGDNVLFKSIRTSAADEKSDIYIFYVTRKSFG